MTRPVRQVALYGYLGSGNIGNDASFETVLLWLKDAHPAIQVSCVTIAPEEISRRYGVPSTLLATRSSRAHRNRLTEFGSKLVGRLIDLPRSYAVAGSADAIVVPGMGVLEDTLGTRPWGFPYWLFLVAAAARARGRRFVLLDVGANRPISRVTRWLNVATSHLATHVSYRDSSSAAVMARLGARQCDAIAPDLAFAHPASRLVKPEAGRVVVGVMAYYGRDQDLVRGAGVRHRYVATMANALRSLIAAGHHIVLVGGDDADVDVAWEVHTAVGEAQPDLPNGAVVVREVATFEDLSDEMRQAEVVVASRFHNLICALRLGRPTISVGYAGKSGDLMRAIGVEGYCQDIEHLDGQALVAQVVAAVRDADILTDQIVRGTAGYAAEVDLLLDEVASKELALAADDRKPPGLLDIQR